ncbi:MAG TPA: aminotransferase class IV [Bacteroidales bacterium]|nr:aminotransferase class IV [Bacteroidales bacterium]HOR59733.1 aminotransferase class IV [Bacteroidales bacterium]HPL04710.1 aminotransferase class IV [Bacteroidales bacterium]
MAKYVSIDGNIQLSEKACISYNNRGLIFGDSFNFEMRGNSSKAFFEDEYFDFFIQSLKFLKFKKSIFHRKTSILTDLELLLQKNRIYKGFKARIIVFRNDTIDNSCSIIISVDAIESEYYPDLANGLTIDVYEDYVVPEYNFEFDFTPRFSEELLLHQKLETLDDFLLCDKNGNIIKSLNSSVFFVKNENLILPTRYVKNASKVFVDIVVKLANDLNIPVINWEIKERDLYSLDEVFLGDITSGFNRVMAFKDKRYFYKTTGKFLEALNNKVKVNFKT